MALRIADILFKDTLAGTLAETAGGGSRFTYATDWIEEIACCFPVTRREHEWKTGLHPYFQHLGPEGWLRERQARAAHIVEDDDLALLLRYGADCIGAVSVRPPGNTPVEAPVNIQTASPGRTVSGIQKKLLVVRDSSDDTFHPAGPTGLAPYIAKFNSESIDTLVRNEALSLRWSAAVLGSNEVSSFQIAEIQALNEFALVVHRFDRGSGGEKLRLEDCAQILCKPRGQDYAGKYDAAYEDVAELIRHHSSRPTIDLARFFSRLIVFVLIGNCDAHLKNFSLLETSTGLRLSPAYDVVNTAVYDGFDQTLALAVDGTKIQLDAVTRDTLEGFGRRIGLPETAVTQIFANLRKTVNRATSIITPPEAEPPEGFLTRFAEIVSRSCLRILET